MDCFKSYVTNISWERIHLFINVKVEQMIDFPNIEFYLINSNWEVETTFKVEQLAATEYKLALNITNNGDNRCIDNGKYSILAYIPEEQYSIVSFEGNVSQLESNMRCFRYLNNTGAYTLTFMLDEYNESPVFQIYIYNMVKQAMGNRSPLSCIEKAPKRLSEKIYEKLTNKIKSAIKKRKKKIKRKVQRIYYTLFENLNFLKNKQRKTILFLSAQDDKLALNMEALYNRMLERGLDKKYNFLFSLRKATSEKQSIISTLRMLRYMAMAEIILVDDHIPVLDWLVLNKETKIIQIWHAGAGFKGVGYSRWGHFGCPGPFSCHRQYTYSIAGSSNIAPFFSEQFGILDEQVIPTGMPRMDQFLNKENRRDVTEKLYELLPEAIDKKVVLFAPTYRGQNRKNAYYPYEIIDFEALYQYCLDFNTVIIFKMHPWVAESVPIDNKYKERFFDLNQYKNINDLFYITDVLITDYSSSMYEYSLMRKPMLAFSFDKVQFATSRGFHRNYDENIPGKICEKFDELICALRTNDYEFEKNEKYLKEHFKYVDDQNSDRVIDWLILNELPHQYKTALEEKLSTREAIRGKSFKYLNPEQVDEDSKQVI